MIRSFVALPLPDDLVTPCLSAQGHVTSGRAVPVENLHVTLLYLGDQSTRALEDLCGELDIIRHPAVSLRLTGIDVIGGWKGARHLVASVAPEPGLVDLQSRVLRAAHTAGLDFERRRFRPHVTLVRDFRGGSLPPWSAPLPPAMVGAMSLFRSTLKKSGAEYDSLVDFRLEN